MRYKMDCRGKLQDVTQAASCGTKQLLQLGALVLSALTFVGCGGAVGGTQEEDPLATDLPIAYVKRPLPVDEDGNPIIENILDPMAFNAGGELFMRARASDEAEEVSLTAGTFPDDELYDVKDVSVSYDGTMLLFSMRAPEDEDADEDEQPTWNIWEYDLTNSSLRRIMLADNTAEGGQDVSPRYLADGRIVFSSTRQRRSKAVLLDEGKPQYEAQEEDRDTDAFVLHTMEPDGTDIQQISFNQSHDLYPSILEDGRVMFLRWDNVNNNNSLSLYTVNPDGSGLNFLYGLHSQDTGTNGVDAAFWSPKQMADGRILALHKQPETENLGGDILAIDAANFTEIDQPLLSSTSGAAEGQESLSVLQVNIDDTVSPHGVFASAWPLYDGTDRIFVGWSQCRLQDIALTEILSCSEDNLARTDVEPAEPLYGLWMYDSINQTQRPIVVPEEGTMYTDAVVVEQRERPDFIPAIEPDSDLESQGVAVINIRSVYDFDGIDMSNAGIENTRNPGIVSADQREARFLRIEKAVSMPDEDTRDFDNSAFGVGGQGQLMREIVGYVPIEPDGSVVAMVPSDVAISLSVLDGNGRRTTQRHENWMHFETSDTIECNGCHTANSEVAHGRFDAQPLSANLGAPVALSSFLNTDPALFIDEVGETMAEVWARINGPRQPSVNIVFDDEWADPALVTPAESFSWTYLGNGTPEDPGLSTPMPVSDACAGSWNSLCRILINYPEHIQPLWDLARPDPDDVLVDNRCTICHSETDEVLLIDQVPAGQIDLRSIQSVEDINYMTSYRELFVQNERQVLDDDGMLVFDLEDSGEIIVDGNGDPVLDDDGNEQPIFVRVAVTPILRTAGANASNAFFTIFEEGASHEDYLTPVELKLISEWLDIGAQYYNNPFDAPLN